MKIKLGIIITVILLLISCTSKEVAKSEEEIRAEVIAEIEAETKQQEEISNEEEISSEEINKELGNIKDTIAVLDFIINNIDV